VKSIVVGSGGLGVVQLSVADRFVSPEHARIVRHDDGTLWVVDLGSTNGTRLTRAGQSAYTGAGVQVRGSAEPWRAGWTLWFGARVGLTLDARGWVKPVRLDL
jgi:hypothetical protein